MKQNRGKTFIPNGSDMNSVTSPTWSYVITGPNMGGKTTYLRSVALCVVLAQMGCYVPARRATIGVIDKVFSRVGSADDIVNDRSTFFNKPVVDSDRRAGQGNERGGGRGAGDECAAVPALDGGVQDAVRHTLPLHHGTSGGGRGEGA